MEVRLREVCPIFVGSGILPDLGSAVGDILAPRRAIVITNATVRDLYGEVVLSSLDVAGLSTDLIEVPEGEEFKSLQVASDLYRRLVSVNAHRYDPIIALGGGVIGDLVGFVAATYMRGVPLVQVPTTLLAQVDSSVGGKVAVNLPEGKNLVGSFYQPSLVYTDVGLLGSLPKREFRSGLAEVIKYGFIRDADFLDFVEKNAEAILGVDGEVLEKVVTQSCAIKAGIVESDERDKGFRAHLNYGHTIGHALEGATGYRQFLHGEAISIGMVGAALISHYQGMLSEDAVERHRIMLSLFGLPDQVRGIGVSKVRKQMEIDKKFTGEANRFVLLKRIGEATVVEGVAQRVIDRALIELGAERDT